MSGNAANFQSKGSRRSRTAQELAPRARRDLALLLMLGRNLDARVRGREVREILIAALLRIRDKQGRLVALSPNAAQREFSRTCGRRNIVLKARQMGMTTWIAARFFAATITRSGTLSVQVAHDQRAAEEIFRIVHRFWANLPESLRMGALRTSRANVRQIVFPLLDSEYRVETAADPDAGRGLTIQHLHASEVARWPRDAAATLASLRAAVPPHGEVVLESTPLGASGCFYAEWQRAAETGHVRHFHPWWWERAYIKANTAVDDPSGEERMLVERHGLTAEQIAFRREIRANFRRLAAQEFAEDPESCFLTSDECVFDPGRIERRLAELADAGALKEGNVRIIFPPAPGREYVIGVDPAGGGAGGDYACAQVIDRELGAQCAELHAHLPPFDLAMEVAELARRYNAALVAVERNNHGHAVLAHLESSARYDHVYEKAGVAGWLTTAASRPRMIASLAAVFSAQPELFSSPKLLREMRTFVRNADGKQAAAAGAHDDCVMAMGIALQVREEVAGKMNGPNPAEFGSLPQRN